MAMPLGIFIAGSSHVGKSSLAQRLGNHTGWRVISTDDLGRHPGRPWPEVRPQVAEFYTGLSAETLHWLLKIHHENMWPRLLQIIEWQETMEEPFILEGAALRPEYLSTLDIDRYKIVSLHVSDPVCACEWKKRPIADMQRLNRNSLSTALLNDRFWIITI